jgi:desulfoferrodoxin-like iron-binding protein
MAEISTIYKCNICGQIVRVEKEGAGTLVCCNVPMEKMPENITQAA